MEVSSCSKRFSSGWPSRLCSLLAFGLALGSSPLWADSPAPLFVPSSVYEVTGAELNRLNADLLTAKRALETSETQNALLARDSVNKQKALERLQAQLTTVSESFKKSQNEALSRDILVGSGCLILGIAAAEAWNALH